MTRAPQDSAQFPARQEGGEVAAGRAAMPVEQPRAVSNPNAPRYKDIKVGRGAMVVSVYPDGSVSLAPSISAIDVRIDLSRDEAGELIAALVPSTAALIETLDLLATAAEEHCPSPLTDDPEVVAEARELRSRIADARALLKEHAS